MSRLPFKQHELAGKLIREFSSDVDDAELVWHRDRRDRDVLIREGVGWKLQMENCLPVDLTPGSVHRIPRGIYHRVMRGNTSLIVEIEEL